MRDAPSRVPTRDADPYSAHSFPDAVAASALLAAATVALVLAASYPVTAAGLGALAVAGWLATRTLRRRYRSRRRTGRTRTVCLPTAGVCVEV